MDEVGPVGQCAGNPLDVWLKLAFDRCGDGVVGVLDGVGEGELRIQSTLGCRWYGNGF